MQQQPQADENAINLVDGRRFADGKALCAHIDGCLDGARRQQPLVVVIGDFVTKEMLYRRYKCELYEYLDKPTRARILGRLSDEERGGGGARNE